MGTRWGCLAAADEGEGEDERPGGAEVSYCPSVSGGSAGVWSYEREEGRAVLCMCSECLIL